MVDCVTKTIRYITTKCSSSKRMRTTKKITYGFGSKPYVEASVGLTNVFKILRVDYVRRLNYLDQPDAPKHGIRARIRFDF